MITLITNLQNQNEDITTNYRFLNIKIDNNILNIECITKINHDQTQTITRSFMFDQIQYGPDKCNFVLSLKSTEQISLEWLSDICEDKIGDYYQKFRYQGNNDNRSTLLSIFIDQYKNLVIIPRYPFVFESSIDIQSAKLSDNTEIQLRNQFQSYDEFCQRIESKRELISKINILDCLTSLENQIDLLYQCMFNNNDDEQFKTIMNAYSSNTIHDKAHMLQSIKNNKSYLRQLQLNYFNSKGNCITNRNGS